MSLFSLETSALDSASSSVQSLASQVRSISSNVSGYDTSCEDGFNFDSAKSVIASNIEACAVKMENTANLLETVSSSHTNLQNSMKFTPGGSNGSSGGGSNGSSGGGSNGSSGSGSNGSSGSGSNGSSGGGSRGSSGGGSNGSSGGGGGYAPPVGLATGVVPAIAPMVPVSEKAEEEDVKNRVGVVDTKISSTGYAVIDKELTTESKALFTDSKFDYKEGYATIGDSFVIACDSSVGQVGDVIEFKQKDGTVVHGVIGVSTHEKSNADKLYFLVDQNSKTLRRSEICDKLIENNSIIENCGSVYDIRNLSSAAKSVSGDTKNISSIISNKVEDVSNVKELTNEQEGVEI